MTLPSIGQSSTGVISPTPSHQAIGRNGSFWLPEKIDPSFESKVKNATPSKEGAKQGASKSVVPGKPGSGEKSSTRTSFSEGRVAVAGKTASGAKSLNAQPLALSKSGLTSAKASQSKSLSSGPVVRSVHPSGSEQALHGQQAKIIRNANRTPTHSEVNSRESVSPDQEGTGNGDKRGGNRGTKNALSETKMDITQSQQDFKVLEGETSRDPVASLAPKARAFVKFLSNTVAPRVAYLDKNARKVVRFAVDLPNKTKLGVRLEESGGSLTLCFICSNPDSLEMLGFTKEALSKSLSAQTGKTARIKVFSNYKEMDEHFLRAA